MISEIGHVYWSIWIKLGLIFTIWTASSGFAAAIDGLNLVQGPRNPAGVENATDCAGTDAGRGISTARSCGIDG